MPKHWNCFVAGCKSNFSTKLDDLKYFRVPKKLQKHYDAFFKTDSVNWQTALICSLHWSKGRKNSDDLPDVRIPQMWSDKSIKLQGEKKRVLPYSRSTKRLKSSARSMLKIARLQSQQAELKNENNDLRREIIELKKDVKCLKEQNKELSSLNVATEREKKELEQRLSAAILAKEKAEEMLKSLKEENKSFGIDFLSDDRMKYLSGLSKEDFLTLYDCFKPFLHVMSYESCKTSQDVRRKLSKENELLACLIICRHAMHLGVMAWILDVSEATMSRIFEAWMVFGQAVFSKLDLHHPKSLIEDMMPTAYKNLGYSHTVLVLDATEIKTTGFSDLKMNELFFSQYKNSHTVKALVCLTPHGTTSMVPGVYPGSITDSRLTDMVGALDNVLCHDGVLTDKGK